MDVVLKPSTSGAWERRQSSCCKVRTDWDRLLHNSPKEILDFRRVQISNILEPLKRIVIVLKGNHAHTNAPITRLNRVLA